VDVGADGGRDQASDREVFVMVGGQGRALGVGVGKIHVGNQVIGRAGPGQALRNLSWLR
jgi:hypothetical protein